MQVQTASWLVLWSLPFYSRSPAGDARVWPDVAGQGASIVRSHVTVLACHICHSAIMRTLDNSYLHCLANLVAIIEDALIGHELGTILYVNPNI